MRLRLLVSSLFAVATVAAPMRAADGQTDAVSEGLAPGDYLRLSGGAVAPVHAQGSLRDWRRGHTMGVAWEGWQPSSNGVGRIGFGIGFDYSRLPLNQAQFIADFQPTTGVHPYSASAPSATAFSIETNFRFRIPAPLVVPSLELGFGYMEFRPSTIQYSGATGTGSATQAHRRGAAFMFGAGVDKQVVDRFALFGEALYTYGLTSLGHGVATPGSSCIINQCDALQNTALAVLRGGLRVRLGP